MMMQEKLLEVESEQLEEFIIKHTKLFRTHKIKLFRNLKSRRIVLSYLKNLGIDYKWLSDYNELKVMPLHINSKALNFQLNMSNNDINKITETIKLKDNGLTIKNYFDIVGTVSKKIKLRTFTFVMNINELKPVYIYIGIGREATITIMFYID